MEFYNFQLEVVNSDISAQKTDAKVDNNGKVDQGALREMIAKSLKDAQGRKQQSLSFSDLGAQSAGFPVSGLAKMMVQEIMNYKRQFDEPSLKKFVFCLSDEDACGEFERTMRSYTKHISEKLGPGPYVTVDIIIELKDGIVLIDRSNPPYGWALPGGFVDYGESLEDAAAREAREETNLVLEGLRQFHTYSRPGRDPRFHTVSTVYIARGKGEPKFGDDAKGLKTIAYSKLLDLNYAFDHHDIIKDYLNVMEGKDDER